MTTVNERPSFWRAPRDYSYPKRQRPQSCVWSPPAQSYTNTLPRYNRVQTGSPVAEEAGLRPNDALLSVNNSPPIRHAAADIRNKLDVQVQRQPGARSNASLSSQSSPRVQFADEQSSSITPYRPVPVLRGIIPHISSYDTSVRKPDSNTEAYLKDKAIEKWAISKQTYRTLPLIEPKPKVHRDWPTGCYMKLMEGPYWHDPPKQLPPPKHLQEVINKYGQGVANNPNVVHLQYNSPMPLYSDENVVNQLSPYIESLLASSPLDRICLIPTDRSCLRLVIKEVIREVIYEMIQSRSPRSTTRAVPPPVVQIKSQLQKPLTVDITQSPTYQLLQEEEEYDDTCKDRSHLQAPGQHHTSHGHSPSKFSPKHSPNYPQQTPYFRSLMNSLLPNPGI